MDGRNGPSVGVPRQRMSLRVSVSHRSGLVGIKAVLPTGSRVAKYLVCASGSQLESAYHSYQELLGIDPIDIASLNIVENIKKHIVIFCPFI